MKDKVKKVEEIPDPIQRFRKNYNRYQRNHTLVVLLGLFAVIAVWYYTNHFWGATALALGIWSLAWYEDGAHENCIDEWEYAYPKDGFRRMCNSWPWFAVIAIIAYFFCKRFMPYFFN